MKKLCVALLCLLLTVLTAAQVYAASSVPAPVMRAAKSVVRVLAEYADGYATGSGFVIKSNAEETLIATNCHVVEDSPYSISVWLDENETISASIAACTEQKDLCVLRLAYPVDLAPLALASAGVNQGEAVYAVGFPGAGDVLSDKEAHTAADATITDGIVSALRTATVTEYGTPVSILQINAAINPGNSGGPLFNAAGEVVGINTYDVYDSQGIFGAIDIRELKTFLTDNAIALPEETRAFPWPLLCAATAVLAGLSAVIVLIQKKKKARTAVETADNAIPFRVYTNPHSDALSPADAVPAAPAAKRHGIPKKAVLAAVIGVCVLSVGAYLGSYAAARAHAQNGNFAAAEKWLPAASLTKLHDAQLISYIEAGRLLDARSYENAGAAFRQLPGYRNADTLAQEADYRRAVQCADADDFDAAIQLMKPLFEIGYKDAADKLLEFRYRQGAYLLLEEDSFTEANAIFAQLVREGYDAAAAMRQETLYLWAASLIEDEAYIDAYNKLNSIRDYADAGTLLAALEEILYIDGQTLYYSGDYAEARAHFRCIHPFADSQKYLTLIEARTMTVPYAQDSLINSLLELFWFEDTAEVLLSNQALAERFLCGSWSGDGHYFDMEPNGNVLHDLPWFGRGDYYYVEDGVFWMYPKEDESALQYEFFFTALTPDCIEVYCYQNGQTYTLYRE